MGLLMALFLLQGCTLQQRRYTGGFHWQWGSGNGGSTSNKHSTLAIGTNTPQNAKILPNHPKNQESHIKKNAVAVSAEQIQHPIIAQEATICATSPKQIYRPEIKPIYKANGNSNLPLTTYANSAHKKKNQSGKNHSKLQRKQGFRPGDNIFDLIIFILGLIAAILGYDTYSGGGGGGWGGRGGYFDWTIFFAVVGACISSFGLIMTLTAGPSMSVGNVKAMLTFFSIFGVIFSGIGLIKSIRDYNDTCKYVSFGSFALLLIMWIIGLSML
jgi:hypothetical protein